MQESISTGRSTMLALFCHVNSARFTDEDGHRLKRAELTSLSCDRYHGPGEQHANHPSANDIVNPAKLPKPERDSICEQCHLEGATRILNPGKQWDDSMPEGRRKQSSLCTCFGAGTTRPLTPLTTSSSLPK